MLEIPARHFSRYYEILSVFIRHGLGYLFIPGNLMPRQEEDLTIIGVRLRNALAELGPAFVKAGQIASTRGDLIPQPIVQELAKLQDRVHPLSFEVVRRVLEGSLQSSLESIYKEFNPVPLGAASIGQVHRAVLHNGDRVAVKVQRPFLRETVKTDIEIFLLLINKIEQNTQWGKRYPFRMMLKEFSDTINRELNFLNEGRNAEKLAKLNKRNSSVVIPKIYWEFSRPSVLTMEYISGIPLHQIIDSQKTSYDVHRIASCLSKALFQQIFLEGFFHADPHPGNVLISPGGKIGLIDFGIIGHLSQSRRDHILSLVSGLIRADNPLVFKTLSQMGILPDSFDLFHFERDLLTLRRKHLRAKKFNMGQSIQGFMDIIFRHGIIIPSEFILLGKSLLTLEGTLSGLDPNFSLINQAKPFIRRSVWGIYWRNLRDKFRGTRETDTTSLPINIQ
ncbi:MAG: AarF/ABC1/UbiB kinase family protein [Desulfosporosinus sp.]|nr:AarF/ABC1/UbiB kinase family protein [Desulfosporosinus sp.]MBC2726548.1 AarF/ABC1/UbiB kinase family protein [Desulfosporosinus sp.]